MRHSGLFLLQTELRVFVAVAANRTGVWSFGLAVKANGRKRVVAANEQQVAKVRRAHRVKRPTGRVNPYSTLYRYCTGYQYSTLVVHRTVPDSVKGARSADF